MTYNSKVNVVVLSFGLLVGIGGFVWALTMDWKLCLAIFLMIWGNNLTRKKDV